MQTTATRNLVFTAFSSFKGLAELEKRPSHAALYQGIAKTLISGFQTTHIFGALANKLASVADHAYAARQLDLVGSVGQLLQILPISDRLESIASYYQALSVNRFGNGDSALAGCLFEQVINNGPLRYRARATVALGSNSLIAGDHKKAILLYREAMQIFTKDKNFDPVTGCIAARMAAVIRGMDEDHEGAVKDLKRMFPLARLARSFQPYVYYDYLNTLAVELAELGRLEQARHASKVAVSSTYGHLYPIWRETLDEIESKTQRPSRSVVAVSHVPSEERDSPTQILSWSADHVRQANSAPRRANHSASIISLQEWKNKVEKKSKHNSRKKPTSEEIRSMDFTEKQATITRYVYADEATEEMLDSILEVAFAPDAGERDGA